MKTINDGKEPKMISKFQKALLIAISILLICVIAATALLLILRSRTPEIPDTVAPIFEGLSDKTVYMGEGISYRAGVKAIDDRDGEIPFSVDSSSVRTDRVGMYTVTYTAKDAAGNKVEKTIQITVCERTVGSEELYALIDPVILQKGWREKSVETVSAELYTYVKATLSYTSDSDKSDATAEAWRGLREGDGDCFTYYAVAKAFFDRIGIEVLTVIRTPNVLPSTHYWLLVNTGTHDAPTWYHWDGCPHYKEYPLYSCLLTDAELLAYNDQVPHYYDFEADKYPATPTE